MDPSQLLPLLPYRTFLLVALGLFVVVKIISSAAFKGGQGERRVRRSLRGLDPSVYQCYHDIYLPKADGQGHTQIDHVVVSPFGIFVIETKNYGGRIFGSEKQNEWTQQFLRSKKQFQNPLQQNRPHVTALKKFLGLPEDRFRSVVLFVGDAVFMTPMPVNVLRRGIVRWIQRHSVQVLGPAELTYARRQLAALEQTTDRKAAARTHLGELRERFQ